VETNRISEIHRKIQSILTIIKSEDFILNEVIDLDLFESNILDSFSILELVTNLESNFKIDIPVEDLNLENLSTIRNIAKYVDMKK
jgi:D-alanine--poly(phosphoribitol) ligase subunit 2